MDQHWRISEDGEYKWEDQTRDQRDLIVQSIISIVFGLAAFIAFCFLRPRWTELYAARKRQKDAASRLPELPDTFLGWIPTLYSISEAEVLASAGLDAFVFLAFFKLAIKFLAVTFFFSLALVLPVHVHYGYDGGNEIGQGNDTDPDALSLAARTLPSILLQDPLNGHQRVQDGMETPPTNFLWMYVALVYLYTALAMYLIISETKKIIRIRQNYLGTQSTVTDRTIRLSGIPPELRSEEKIKETVEDLEIGKVESVMLCKDWTELDGLIDERMNVLRKLEEAWTVHLGYRRVERNLESLPIVQPPPPEPVADGEDEDEQSRLLRGDDPEQNHVTPYARDRPTTRIWYGFLKLQSRLVDAIDYYEERLRKLDERVKSARKKDCRPTPLAFVTLDSTAACQMAIQAIMDPEPMQLLAKLAPAPSDVVWPNTYLSRSNRMIRSWSVTLIILILTVFWSILLVPLVGLLNLDSIHKVWPQLADALARRPITASLVQSGLPTLIVSLLNVAVPYVYYWLATLQGMISQGEIELSVISKNFFFVFFNLFVVFTIFGTASNAYTLFDDLGENLKDTTRVAYVLAQSLQKLAPFYINLIILQGLGLFPFRLLEFGSVFMYPITLIGAKTPRDYAELVQPPVFSYGFYLPQTILIFIICTVYSILPRSWLVLFFGLVYFVIGSFIYKYQLLYAMDHRQHSTGRAWGIICNRIIVGLVVFQLAMAGVLALKLAIKRSVLIIPLLFGTIWFAYFYRRTYEPLLKFIAIRSLHDETAPGRVPRGESRHDIETDHGRAVDGDEDSGLRYINPSLIIPLEEVWVSRKRTNGSVHVVPDNGEENVWE